MKLLAFVALMLAQSAVAEEITDPELLRQLNDRPETPREQTDPKPWARDPVVQTEKLGPGPHTLVISDGDSMTRMEYASGPKCQKARDEVRRQNAPPPSTPGVIYAPSRIKAFCVPR